MIYMDRFYWDILGFCFELLIYLFCAGLLVFLFLALICLPLAFFIKIKEELDMEKLR